ncbi:MAG: hypothetical protein R2911_44610 [Caldilineaceae bacterium]
MPWFHNMDPVYFEKQAQAVGFQIIERDPVDSEWREKLGRKRACAPRPNSWLQIAHERDRERLLGEMGRGLHGGVGQ